MSFGYNAEQLKQYEIGDILPELNGKSHIIVGVLNIPTGMGSNPDLLLIPENKLGSYLTFSRGRQVKNSLDALDFARDKRSDVISIPLRGIFELYPPTGRTHEINPRVPALLETAKDFPLGSRPIPESQGYVVDGRFLGIDKNGEPTVFITMYNFSYPDKGPSLYKTMDVADLRPTAPVTTLGSIEKPGTHPA